MNQRLHLGVITLSLFLLIFGGLSAQSRNDGNTPSNNAPLTVPQRLRIHLTLGDPTELKVQEGDLVTRGQVLSDREAERSRLERDKRERLLAIATIEQQQIYQPPPAPSVRELPAVSYTVEENTIQLAEIRLAQAQRNLSAALQADPFLTARAKVDRARSEVEAASRTVELQQRKLDAINGLSGLPPEMVAHETEKLKQAQSNLDGKQASYDFFLAEYRQVEIDRQREITDLQSKVTIARGELEKAQSRLRAAKEQREMTEYQHRITLARRTEEENQTAISLANQKLDREFKLAQLREQLSAVEEKLNGIVQVKSPYSGTVRRIKFDRQTDGKLAVTLYLDTSPSSTSGSGS